MKEWPIPKTLKKLRGFLGLIGYYRKFVKNYGQMVAPVPTLLKKEDFLGLKKQPKLLKNLRRLCVQLLS
jgi:hypothetical protein